MQQNLCPFLGQLTYSPVLLMPGALNVHRAWRKEHGQNSMHRAWPTLMYEQVIAYLNLGTQYTPILHSHAKSIHRKLTEDECTDVPVIIT